MHKKNHESKSKDQFHLQFKLMNQDTLRKRQKRKWYHRNKEAVLEQQKNSKNKKESQKDWYQQNKKRCIARAKRWNEDNPVARKLIVERHKTKNNPTGGWSNGT